MYTYIHGAHLGAYPWCQHAAGREFGKEFLHVAIFLFLIRPRCCNKSLPFAFVLYHSAPLSVCWTFIGENCSYQPPASVYPG